MPVGLDCCGPTDEVPTGRARAKRPICLQAAGIPETLVRLSVGVEDTADLIQDIQQALTAAGMKVLHVINGGNLR